MRRLGPLLAACLACLAAGSPLPGTAAPSVPPASEPPARLGLQGTVTGPDGRPAAGAVVLLRHGSRLSPGSLSQRSALSDAAGRFRFAGLPWDAAEARLAARLPGRALAVAAEGTPADLLPAAPPAELRLAPGPSLRVTFRVPQGMPPAEGAVSLEGDGRWIPFAASEALLTGLPPGPAGIKYHSEVYGSGVFFADFRAGRDKDTALDLAVPDWVAGVLRDAEGAPVAGALYRAENAFRGMVSRTGPDGTFRVRRGRPGTLAVHVRHPGFRDTVLVLPRGAESAPLDVRLDAGAAPIRGTVLPAVGDPRLCLVAAHPLDARRAARSRWPGGEVRRALPDSSGAFALRGLEPETYRVRIECPSADLWEDTARPGAILAEAAPGPARPLAGRVLSAAGSAPLPAAAVALSGTAPESPEAALAEADSRADSLGRFAFAPRFAGTAFLCASAPGHAAACRPVASGDTSPVLLSLEASARLLVRALASPDSAPLAGARVRVRRAGAKGPGWSGETGPDGTLAAEGLGRGDYVVEVRQGSRLPIRAAQRIEGDGRFTAVLLPADTLAGTLLDAQGRPARGLRVLARAEWPAGPACPGGIVEAPLSADGSFSLTGLGACPTTLGVAALRSRAAPFLPLWRLDGVDPASGPLEVRLPARRTWEITVASGGRPLAGAAEIHLLVLPAVGKPAAEALGHPLGRAAFRGSYAVSAFVGQRYVAVVSAPGHGGAADTVLIPAGEEPYETRIDLPARPGLRGRLAASGEQAAARPAGWTVRSPGAASAPVGEGGAFELPGLPPGPVPLEVRDARGALLWAGAGLAGAANDLPGPAAPAWTRAVAVDAEGRPIAGAAVVLRRREGGPELSRAVSDGEGRFAFLAPPGPWLLCPDDEALPCTRLPRADTAARVRLAWGNRYATFAPAPPLPLPWRGAAALAGPGAGPDGFLPLEPAGGEVLPPSLAFRTVPAGPAGAYRFVAAAYRPRDPADSARSSAPSLFWSEEPAAPGAARPAGTVYPVAVSARDADGRPLAGVGIRFLPRSGNAGGARPWGEAEGWRPPASLLAGTDSAGALNCLGVRPGRYWIYASHPTHAAPPVAWEGRAAGPPAAVSLVLRPGSPVRVRATFGGFPLAAARAEVLDTLGNRAAPAVWGPGDLMELGAFPAGAYRVAVTAPGLGSVVRTAELAAGAEANLEAALPPSGWLEVVGEELEDKVFYLKDSADRVIPLVRHDEVAPVGPDGRTGVSTLFRGIAPDRYEVWMEGSPKGLGKVEILPARVTVLDVGRPARVRVALPVRRG